MILPPPVKELALKHGFPVLQPATLKKNTDLIKLFKELKPDFIVVVAYGKLLPPEILEIPKYGCINVHGSLLPNYRGASPIEEALLHGDKETGISITKMVEKLDSGPVYLLKRIPIEKEDNTISLRLKLSLIGAAFLPETLKAIKDGDLNALPQNENKATYCHKIKKENGLINLEKETAEEILNKIRAYTPWPSCYMFIKDKQLKILEAETDPEKQLPPGKTLEIAKNKIAIGTKKGLLIPKKVQLEGKKPTSIENFLLGNRELFKDTQDTIPKNTHSKQ